MCLYFDEVKVGDYLCLSYANYLNVTNPKRIVKVVWQGTSQIGYVLVGVIKQNKFLSLLECKKRKIPFRIKRTLTAKSFDRNLRINSFKCSSKGKQFKKLK